MIRIKWFTGKFRTLKAVAVLDRADIVDAELIESLSIGNREDIRDGKIANRMFVDWCYGGWCEVTDVECPDNKDH